MTRQEKIEMTRLVGSLNHQCKHAQQVSEYVRQNYPADIMLLTTLRVQSREMVANHNELNKLSGNVPSVNSHKHPWDDDSDLAGDDKRPWND